MNFLPATEQSDQPVVEDDKLAQVPHGALALAGIAVGLLVLAWLSIYFFAFLPRGPVG